MATAKIKTAVEKTAVKKSIKKKQLKQTIAKASEKKAGRGIFRPDIKQTNALQKLGLTGASNAIRASKALGLPITYMENGVVVREQSNGVKEILVTLAIPPTKSTALSLKKGMIFHAKK